MANNKKGGKGGEKMKRLMLVCMAVAVVAVFIMFGSARVSSAQQQAVPPIAHHEIIENAQPGAFQSSTPPTGAGAQFQGPGTTTFNGPVVTIAPRPTPNQAVNPGATSVPPMAHHEIYEGMQPGSLQSGKPPTGAGEQFKGPEVTTFSGSVMTGAQAPAK